ncbi:MAG: type 1 glutamine amidotransferase [Acidimicrobiia bacterium]
MKALVIEQDESEKSALVGELLVERGFVLESFVVQRDVSSPGGRTDFPEPDGYDLILPMGSPWSVHDPSIAEWLVPELELLAGATKAGVPVFGICFGAQALAAATGGTVRRAPVPEIGWREVVSNVPAIAGRWFQWHQDVFTVGPDATVLAHSQVGQQVFRVGRSVGVQFHPEVNGDHLAFWLASGGATEMEAQGGDPAEVLASTRAKDPEMRVRVSDLLDWFLEEVAGS